MVDFIIVGAGLSGTCLAYRLEKAGKSFRVFDDNSQKASKVAGGIINPVILKRFTLAPGADEQLEMALEFYSGMEEDLKKPFLQDLELYRRFSSIEEQNNWFAAADKPRLAPFLDTHLVSKLNDHIPGRFCFGKVLKTARLDIKGLLDYYSAYLQKKGWLNKTSFEYTELKISASQVKYKDISAGNIIFCEGFGLRENPFFNYLPLKGNKGEYLIIRAPGLDLKVGIKSSIFIFPAGGDLYKVGATYNNNDKTQHPTKEGREELLAKLKDILRTDFEVVDQVAGIRPTTADRRPLVGRHPEYENLYTCNGFGSRGILLAPAVSRELLNFIEKGETLSPETDISRFSQRWEKTT